VDLGLLPVPRGTWSFHGHFKDCNGMSHPALAGPDGDKRSGVSGMGGGPTSAGSSMLPVLLDNGTDCVYR
jgi:hypothetical protein